MTLESTLLARADSACELCGAGEALAVYAVPPEGDGTAAQSALLCETCSFQIDNPGNEDINHWRCLNDSMWSQEPAVQVLAWRMLTRLRAEGWPQDLLDMLYLDDETLAWAQATGEGKSEEEKVEHRDSNGRTAAMFAALYGYSACLRDTSRRARTARTTRRTRTLALAS